MPLIIWVLPQKRNSRTDLEEDSLSSGNSENVFLTVEATAFEYAHSFCGIPRVDNPPALAGGFS
jgi:hypothetical protein